MADDKGKKSKGKKKRVKKKRAVWHRSYSSDV